MPIELTYRHSERDDLIAAFYTQLIETGQIEWHCRRHGVIRNVPKPLRGFYNEVIVYHNGSKSAWWDGKGNVEFFNNTKVYPPATKPWGWCGTTVIFQEWQDRIELAHTFVMGEAVEFTDREGVTHRGYVSGTTDRVAVIVPNVPGSGAGGKWHISANHLRRVL